MKNQYFGDINDYRKYGLLRAIAKATGFRILIAWMLTPDDGSTDGKFISYLDFADMRAHHDPVLFQTIRELLRSGNRSVDLIEGSELIPKAEYFSDPMSDMADDRSKWFDKLVQFANNSDFVFLDPDNGLEIKSRPYGGKLSSKYFYWRKVKALWASGRSLLIYQHFIRERRPNFIQRMLSTLNRSTPGSIVEAFSTSHVVFLMALQPEHHKFYHSIVNSVQENWKGQIHHWELTQDQQASSEALRQYPVQTMPAEVSH